MLPKHHKTSFFLNAKLFDNLSSFAELEVRISKLPTTIDVGDAFEVFAEAYFFTQKIEQAEEIYPFKAIPNSIKESLSLGTNQQDMGVDGVYKTASGTFNAYQAKFRTVRPSLTWSEISTFMGLTDNVNQRVLFTNCNDMPSVINDRTGFHCIRGNDLDRLNKNDFKTILKWLQSGEVEVERKSPLPHQDEAINDILTALKDEDRATALMACGTGKTLIALWVSEQMDCQNILVLLPSLTLVRQTLHEWLKETEWKHLSYLCVCSDSTVASKELDSIKVNQSDLDFAVTTEGNAVKQFLSQDTKGVKIVFSTYQSVHIVAAGMDTDCKFDLGIFDEAHKTAGRTDKKFCFALKDENLSIQKRLFLTATPRHYNMNKRNKDGDFDLVYSMDNYGVYGKIAHQLSFAKAASLGIICNYKVIISVVTSEQVCKELLKSGEVSINGDLVNALLIAHQIALKEAIEKYKIKRIFTFHKSVATAKSFTVKGSEGIRTQLTGFNTFHVNGTMTTANRESIMNEFRHSDYSVLSNARCLTEGVDLPAVDMVAFMSPKKSKVDIIQATGRAMRKDPQNPDKTLGYIFVPLYLEMAKGESIENAVNKADFEEVWNVLQALQEQDEVLADKIRQIQEDKGRGEVRGGNDFGDLVDTFGVDISLNTLRKSITAVCINKLGFTWDMKYGELIEFKKQFGHCNVPSTPKRRQLYNWVSRQRILCQGENLTEDHIKRLNDIGFEWNLRKSNWNRMFEALETYKDRYGDCNVPSSWPENKQLASWVGKQRSNQRQSKLSEKKLKRLDKIGFEWGQKEANSRNPSSKPQPCEDMFAVLKEYKEEYGDCNVPTLWAKNKKLGRWVSQQRKLYRNKMLSDDRIKCLENIGFAWDVNHFLWEMMFNSLYKYKQIYGNCNVLPSDTENKSLAIWVVRQRQKYRKGRLSGEQFKRLEGIKFEWKPKAIRDNKRYYNAIWDKRYNALVEYKNNHGNCDVPVGCPEDPQLASWVVRQRANYREGKLRDGYVKQLEDLGFEWKII